MTDVKVGDTVWIAISDGVEKWVDCPDCLGSGRLAVILGDGSKVGIDCVCCNADLSEYRGRPKGKIKAYDYSPRVIADTICRIEMGVETIYGIGIVGGNTWRPRKKVFHSEAEANIEAKRITEERKLEQENDLLNLKDHKGRQKSWAWNATYHRGEIRSLEEKIKRHRIRLAVAEEKSDGVQKSK